MSRRVAPASLLIGLLLAGVACSGSDSDKAGGSQDGAPLVLTLMSVEENDFNGAPEFAKAVERLSRGAMRIELVEDTRVGDAEPALVEAVRSGKAQLGLVPVRAWDRIGVTSFRALLAPFLVNSLELQRRVVARPSAARMLAGVRQAGVVGIALLPGPLRRPFGASRPLVGREDYRGAALGIRPSGVAQATSVTLGAVPTVFEPGSLAGLDGAELDLTTLAHNGYDLSGGTLTTNVVLWPKPYSIVMNPEAFDSLTAGQRQLLHRAAREAVAGEQRQIARDDATALSEMCRRGRLTLVAASPSDLAALRRAVQPLYDDLAEDPVTRDEIRAIGGLRGTAHAVSGGPSCAKPAARARPSAGGRPVSAIDGRWAWDWSRAELLSAGVREQDVPGLMGAGFVEFARGRFRASGSQGHSAGSFALDGDVIRMTFDAPAPPGTLAGKAYELRWSLFRDSLAFAPVPGREPLGAMLVEPLTRVR